MKTVKSILTLTFVVISLASFSQSKFYDKDGGKEKVIGDQLSLSFTTDESITIPKKTTKPDGFVSPVLLASALPEILDLGFEITTKQIEKNVKKYTNEVSTRNSFDQESKLPSIELKREIRKVGSPSSEEALTIKLSPKHLYGHSYVYELVTINCNYSGAKVKKKYGFNNYVLELKLVFLDSLQSEKKEQETSALIIPMVELGKEKSISNIKTDIFLIPAGSSLAEAHLKVVETNSYKVKAEQLNSIVEDHGEKVQETTKTIVNYYLEKAKEEEDENDED